MAVVLFLPDGLVSLLAEPDECVGTPATRPRRRRLHTDGEPRSDTEEATPMTVLEVENSPARSAASPRSTG